MIGNGIPAKPLRALFEESAQIHRGGNTAGKRRNLRAQQLLRTLERSNLLGGRAVIVSGLVILIARRSYNCDRMHTVLLQRQEICGVLKHHQGFLGRFERKLQMSGPKNTLVCDPGTCPPPSIQTPTTNYNYVPGVFYFDVGVNWLWRPGTQLYAKVDNVANTMPPPTGGRPNNIVYDVIGRMYRIGVRFNE